MLHYKAVSVYVSAQEMALAIRRGRKGKEGTQSGLGDNYIRIQFFLKLKLESTKLRGNSPFLILSSST